MQAFPSRARSIAPPKPVRTVLAAAIAVALLGGCQSGGGNRADPLNDLRGPTRDLSVEFHEGTDMAAAPSPDGRRIVFSAQGALWMVPAGGGPAVRITGWHMEPTAPVFSPDGSRIAFQNYAPEGNWHVWTIDVDGGNAREVTTGPNDDREPAWTPDGARLVFSSDRSNDGQTKIWSVDAGGGDLRRITTGPGMESNPVVSPDGSRVAYVDGANVDTAPIAGGAPTVVAPGTAPAWTPDGAGLVYQNADRQLVVNGAVVTTNEDIFPFPVRWLPDGRFLYTADGRIRVRSGAGATPADIPFSARLEVRRPVLSHPKDRHFDDACPRRVNGISAPALSPDGQSIAFVALNDVWVMRIGEAPRRLTNDTDRDIGPQWTADGRAVYFSSERGNGGQLAVDQVDVASGARTRLAAIPGRSMANPKLSPDGARIAYTTLAGQLEIWTRATGTFEVILAPVGNEVSTPQWLPDGRRILLVDNERINNRFREGYNKLRVVDLATRRATFYPVAPAPQQISDRDEGAAVLSPDGTQVAFIMDSLLHVMPLNADGSPAGAPRALVREAADLPAWGDSRTLLYKSANDVRIVHTDGGAPVTVPVGLQWRQAQPQGTTLIHAGALWDGLSPSLRYDVDLLVRGHRIAWVRPHRAGSESQADHFVDASNLTVMPGLIEPHAHPLTLYQGAQVGQWLPLMLSYGITSAQSVGGPLHQSVELRESLAAGNLVGPRLFVSPPLWEGNRLYYSFARTLRTPAVADLEIAKADHMDADFLKSYVRAPIPVMARIAQGALDQGVPSGTHLIQPGVGVGLEGTTHLSATQRMGYGWSKSFVKAITYQDAYDIYGKGGFNLIDTLFSASVLAGSDPGLLTDPRFILVPPNFAAGLNVPPPTPAQMATVINDATQQAKVWAAGALVANGTDSPLVTPGIQLHLNLRAAGMVLGNYVALQTVTINAAKYALVDRDLGSIEEGKLADLVAVRGNPLADLRAAADVAYVMKNGRTYTLPEILAPFRTPAAVRAKEAAVSAYRARCAAHPRECEHDRGHAD